MKIHQIVLIVVALLHAAHLPAEESHVNVLIWDERQPRQAEAYENFLGNEIAARLSASADDLEIRSVALDDPEQGLSAVNLEWADVIVWWGHVRQNAVEEEKARQIVDFIRAGKLDLIALNYKARDNHNAHTPFQISPASNTNLGPYQK